MRRFLPWGIASLLVVVMIAGSIVLFSLPPQLTYEERTIRVGSTFLAVDLADTEEKKIRGLSHRETFGEDRGMLFFYDTPLIPTFWMKDMEIALDLIWIGVDWRIAEITPNVSPASFPQTFSPSLPVQYVLEVNAGWADAHGVRIGDTVFFSPDVADSPDFADPKDSAVSSFDPIGSKHYIPFTPQAPFAEWENPRYQDGCEEASLVMVDRWLRGEGMTREEARDEILALSRYQEETRGYFEDTSAADTAKLFQEYYGWKNVEAIPDIDTEDIRQAVEEGSVVIVPVNGRAMKNPYYTQPGPERHMLVVYEYDAKTDEFIVHDPGTKHGESYRYRRSVLGSALRDYPSGKRLPGTEERTAMIVIFR